MRDKKILGLGMALAMGCMPETIQANTSLADSSKVYDIDEVVVVSQPKEVYRLRQQSLSSTSLGTLQMQRLGSYDLRELSSYIPNFTMPQYGSRLSSAMYVRGIGSRVNSPAVGIYLDGIPVMSKAAFNLHSYQSSRIDFLRGPQATLYGQNSEGGLVRIYSRDPFEHDGTDVKLGYGLRNYRQVEAAHYVHWGDKVSLSVAAFYEGQDGYMHRLSSDEYADGYNEAGGKMQLQWRMGKGWRLGLLTNYQYADQNAFPYGKLDLSTGKADLPATTFPGVYRRNTLISGLQLYHEGSRWDFASTTSYQYLKDYMLMDQDYVAVDYMSLRQRQLQNSVTQELSWKTHRPLGGFWHLATGAFFSHVWLKTDAPVSFGSGITDPIAMGVQRQMREAIIGAMAQRMVAQGMTQTAARHAAEQAVEQAGGISLHAAMEAPGLFHTPQTNLGLYHESTFDVLPRLSATIGLRYDLMHTSIHYEASAMMSMAANVMGAMATNTLRSALDGRASADYHQLLPKIGVNWRIDPLGSNLYAVVSKGYRAGGYNIQMFSDILQTELLANYQQAMRGDYDVPHTADDLDKVNSTIAFKPETSWNYEAGAHLNLFDNMLHIDLSAFYMQVRNQQLSVMAGNYGYGRMMVNAGKSHSCGIEAALKGQLLDGKLDWLANYGYTLAKFDNYTDGEGEQAVSYQGKYVPYVPQHTMAAMVDYHLLGWLTLGVNVNAQGKTYWDNANSYSQNLYAVLGAHVDAVLGKVRVSLWGRNLTNNNYNTFAVDNAATGERLYFAQRANPFHCGVDVALHF